MPYSSDSAANKKSQIPDDHDKVTYPWWLGGVAATMAAVTTHPLDLAKVKMQLAQTGNLFVVLSTSIKQDGLRKGAYTGLSASIMRQMTYSLVRFGVYDSVKHRLCGTTEHPPVWKLFVAGSCAGAAGGLAGNPADIILVRMISDSAKTKQERFNYRNCFDGLFQIFKTEGPKALFRGLGPNTVRAILMNTSQLATYDLFKDLLLTTTNLEDGMPLHFCTSVISGTVATTVCAPFDVVKSRIMSGSAKESALAVVRASLAKEGPRFLMKGWTAAWLRLGPNTVAVFMIFEQLRNLTDYLRHRKP